jgi:basic membrane lipoprotein Med (substrate-binding protein (PBP1-ABC) superfamily)
VLTWTRRRKILAGVVAGAVVLAGLSVWLLWSDDPQQPAAREREYRDTTACLLTDDHGVEGDLAKPAWAGMQEASGASRVQVEYLAIVGPQTAENGVTFFNTLGTQGCTVIVAVGPMPVASMALGYKQFPKIRCVAVGGDPQGTSLAVVQTGSAETIRSGVKDAVAKI